MLNLTVMPAAEAFNFGEVSISWYGVVIALAVLSGFIIALRLAKKKNLDQDHIYNLLVILTVVGVFGGRLVYVLIEWGYYRNNLIDLIKIWQGGLSIFGVILGALISLILLELEFLGSNVTQDRILLCKLLLLDALLLL